MKNKLKVRNYEGYSLEGKENEITFDQQQYVAYDGNNRAGA